MKENVIATNGKKNRNLGHRAERLYAVRFRELFSGCKTSRESSRHYDNCGIDLHGIPYHVQIKAGKQKGLSPEKELIYMLENVTREKLPVLPKLLIFHKQVTQGKKRTEFDSMVYITFEDFFKIIKECSNSISTTRQ
jgi:hypothetical protein